MGAESLGGYSVETCRAHIVQEEQRLPVLRFLDRRSAAAYPILGVSHVLCQKRSLFFPRPSSLHVPALLHQRDPSLARSQAERLVWQQIEEALLTQASDQQEARKDDQRES
jgi:hypothetical protein